jgi:hypothetical protein
MGRVVGGAQGRRARGSEGRTPEGRGSEGWRIGAGWAWTSRGLRRSDRGSSPRWATGRPSRSPTGMVVPFASRSCGLCGYGPFRVASPRHRDAAPESASAFARQRLRANPLRDRVIRLAINVPSHSESTARLHNVRSLLLCAGVACVVKVPDSKQLRPLRHNKSSISPQMIELKLRPTTLWRNGLPSDGAGRVDARFVPR